MSSPELIKALLNRILSSPIFEFRCTFQILTSVLPKAILVEANQILNAVIPKDHSNALAFGYASNFNRETCEGKNSPSNLLRF